MSISRKKTAVVPSELTNINQIDFNSLATPPAESEGRLYYDNTTQALTITSDIPNTSLQIGQEMWKRIKNESGGILNNGDLVYISGASGNLPLAEKAIADTFSKSIIIGMITSDVLNNAEGWATIFGEVKEIDTSLFTAGTPLYLSPTTPGAYTDTKPTGLNNVVRVGVIIKSGVTDGEILIQPISLGRVESPLAEIYISNNATPTTINTVNVWVPIPQITQSGQLLGFTHNGTGVITLSSTIEELSGLYKVSAAIASAAIVNNKTYEYAIFKNGVLQGNTISTRRFSSGDIGAQPLTGILSLEGGDVIDLRVRNVTDSTNIIVANVNLNLLKIGS